MFKYYIYLLEIIFKRFSMFHLEYFFDAVILFFPKLNEIEIILRHNIIVNLSNVLYSGISCTAQCGGNIGT